MSDPFTLSVIEASLDAAAAEMFAVLKKTAMSPIIYEVLDVGTGITDAEGNLVSSGAGIPTFVGVLDKAVKAILARHGDGIRDGDVFLLNDPNHGGVTHLNDMVVAEPVFHDGRLVAWAASIAHWGDVGGKTPGSMAADAADIFAEGLRLPAVRLFEAGRRNAAVFDIIAANGRLPETATGDLWAQRAAGRRGAARLRAIYRAHGADRVAEAVATAFARGTARTRAGLAALPPGTYRIEDLQDDGSRWRAAITIAPDRFTVDLRDNPAARAAPFNTARDGAVIAAQMIFKAMTDPDRFANAGSFAPLTVLTRPGTIFDPGPTAPHGYYFETRIRLFDLLWRCLAEALPGRLPAGHFGSIFGVVLAGRHPDTGHRYTMVEPQMGGWGATANRDGGDAMFSASHGDTYNCPAEIAEARYGLEVLEKSLALRPDGPAHRGGRGLCHRLRLRGPAVLSAGLSRAVAPVWSEPGLAPGGRNRLTIHRADGRAEDHRFVSGLPLDPGDEIRIETAQGGGAHPA